MIQEFSKHRLIFSQEGGSAIPALLIFLSLFGVMVVSALQSSFVLQAASDEGVSVQSLSLSLLASSSTQQPVVLRENGAALPDLFPALPELKIALNDQLSKRSSGTWCYPMALYDLGANCNSLPASEISLASEDYDTTGCSGALSLAAGEINACRTVLNDYLSRLSTLPVTASLRCQYALLCAINRTSGQAVPIPLGFSLGALDPYLVE